MAHHYQTTIIVDQPQDVVFQAVADVEKYPEFLTFWNKAVKNAFEENKWEVEHEVGFQKHNFNFNVRGELDPPNRIAMYSENAPFKKFDAAFEFETVNGDMTRLTFKVDYELRDERLEKIAHLAADKLYDHAVAQFRKRAHEIGRSPQDPDHL
jgi:ribosome-associated toxin RatA of RatAB toxin-antitoxin module